MNDKENGRYEFIRPVSQTQEAQVYLARDQQLNCLVILKLLNEKTSPDSNLVRDYQRAQKAAAGLTHPYLVKTQNIGLTTAEQLYTVSECLIGGASASTLHTLAEVDKPVSPALSLNLIQKVAEALAEASQAGLIHKKLRPKNILVRPSGAPALLELDSPAGLSSSEEIESAYASPEQQQGKTLDSRSNIYTLGVILYELLYGVLPGDTLTSPPTDISPETLRVVENCRQEQPWARYQNLAEMIAAIDQALLAESAGTGIAPISAAASTPPIENGATNKPPVQSPSVSSRWLPLAATGLFLALLGLAMFNAWTSTSANSSVPIFDQLPLLLGGENSPARQTAESEAATATIRALQFRRPTKTPVPTAGADEAGLNEEVVDIPRPPIIGPTRTPTPIPPTSVPTATPPSPTSPPPPPAPTTTPSPTNTNTPPPAPSATPPAGPTPPPPPPPPPPSPTATPPPSPTNAPTNTPVPTTTPEPTPTPPQPATPTPPVFPTSTPTADTPTASPF